MVITETLLTNAGANQFFRNGNLFLYSYPLESLLRYIAIKHSAEDDISKVQLIKTRYMGAPPTEERCISAAEDSSLTVFAAERGHDVPVLTTEGWTSLDTPPFPVAPYLSKASETKAYYNESTKQAILFVRTATDAWVMLLCSTIFRLLPWIYKTDEDISDEEKEIFRLFASKQPDLNKFNEIINNFAAQYDFKGMAMQRDLVNWGKGSIQQQILNIESDIETIRNRINECERSLSAWYDAISTDLVRIKALQAASNSDSEDYSFANFIKQHQQITIDTIFDESHLTFMVTDTIEFYDQDEFKNVYNNPYSWLGNDPFMRKLYWGLFGANKGVLRTESHFRLTNLTGLGVSKNFTRLKPSTHIAHPHHRDYGCLGANGTYIRQYLLDGNWDLAIEQAIASVKNINFGDQTVMSNLRSHLFAERDSCRCIIADNGVEMTPIEFVAYITTPENETGDTENG